jgi:hypothetical protein
MKKSITGVVALLAGAFVAHSQGTVEFGNYANTTPYTYVSLSSGGTKTLLGGSAANTGNFAADTGSGADWTVALYGNAAGSTPVQLDTSGGTPVTATMEVNDASDTVAGTWFSTAIGVVPGTTLAGQSVTLQVYAWYNNGGTINNYAAAQAANVPTGFSSTVTGTTGGPNSSGPSSTPSSYAFPNFSVSATTPEPSTIALGVMGASAFLMRLRKKQ